jgi:DHA1 family inner membrane transport protein
MFVTTRSARKQTTGAGDGMEMRPKPGLKTALTPPIVRLLTGLVAERICFGLSAFYYPAYLRTTYDLGLRDIALPLMAFAAGNILGTIIGGQLADRYAKRRVSFSMTLIISGLIALHWYSWHPGLSITVTIGFVFALVNALGRPPLMAALASVPEDVRGTIMGLNSTIASLGWLIAALGGGWLYAGTGFVGFGPIMLVLAIFGSTVVFYGKDTPVAAPVGGAA